MLKAFSRLMLVSCFIAAVISQNDVGSSSDPRPNDGEGNQIPDNTCVFWGDPHIWTFDSAMYSYQDPGWHHVLIGPNLNIQANFVPGCYTPIPTNACAKDLRIFVLDANNNVDLIEVYLSDNQQDGFNQVFQNSEWYQILINGKDSQLYSVWNGQQITYPGVKPNTKVPIGNANAVGYYYLPQDSLFQLKFVINNDIVIGYIPNVLTITPTEYRLRSNSLWNSICGLCGTFNGYSGDDFNVHQLYQNGSYPLDNDHVEAFGNTWAIDYQPSGAQPPVLTPVANSYVFTCNFQPQPTPPPTQPPSSSGSSSTGVTRPPTQVPSPTPSPTPSNAPPTTTPAPTPAPTPSATPRPTPSPTPSTTPGPTFPPTGPATQPPTNPPTNTPAPTPSITPSPTPGPTTPANNTYNYTNVDNTTAITNAQGTPIYDDALTSCANAGLTEGDPLWASCMYDVTQTNTTSLAVASAGALVLAGCAKTNLTDTSCVANTLFACPGACNANGACVNGKCNCNKGYQGATCTKAPLLTPAQLAAVISGGAIAGIAIGGAVFAGVAGFGAKKGYDYYHMKDNKMANVNSNPLYAEKNTGGVSPLYAEKA